MRNYSRKFRRNYRGGVWPFDDESTEPSLVQKTEDKASEAYNKVTSMFSSSDGYSSEPSLAQKTKDKASEAYNKVTSMFSSDDSAQSGGRRSRRRRNRQTKRRRSRNRR